MRQARPTSFRRPLAFGLVMLVALYLLFGRGGGSASYDPALLLQRAPPPAPTPPIKYSVVVPTYHERANLRPLVARTFAALKRPGASEIVLVDDDSRDGTVEEVAALRRDGYNVVLVVRTGEKGLSGAVLRGFEEAHGQSLVVMDADLQHPPEAVQGLFDALENPKTPFALGTRYGPGVAMDANWPVYRRVISWGARLLARPLTSASDPMTGFFGIRKDYFLRAAPLNASGFKIALELLLKAPLPPRGIAEVPFSFGTRSVGESKLSSKVMLRYVGQLYTLYWHAWGLFFPVLVFALASAGGALALAALRAADRRWRLGWGLAAPRPRLKSEV